MTGSASDGATAAPLTAPRHATTPACTGGCRVTPARTSSVRPLLTVGYVTPYGFTLRRWTLGGHHHHHHYLLSGRSRRKQREPAGIEQNTGRGEIVVAAAERYQRWRTRGRRRRRRPERYAVMHHRPAPVCLPAA
ncbi:protein E20B [Elephant endotheliotropic herpesvirus 3B]|nr:protein E20B [Elephant endotheliotropic herpesvirus 3B]